MKKILPLLLCLVLSIFTLARGAKSPHITAADAKALIKDTNEEEVGSDDDDENADGASNDDENANDDNGDDAAGDEDGGDDEGADDGDADGGGQSGPSI